MESPRDVDAGDGVHLDGDVQFHGLSGWFGGDLRLTGVECRQHMARQMPRRNQHGVETQFEFGMLGMRHQPGLRGIDDALLLARRHGDRRRHPASRGP